MKKVILIIILGLTVLLTGCDNNKGPYETRKENGKLVLYSDGKLAKGWITNTVQDRSGNSIIVSEIYYDKGLPAGDFILRNLNGYTVAEAKGKWTRPGSFKGTMNSHNSKSKGIYSINSNYLIDFEKHLEFPIKECLMDGEYSGHIFIYGRNVKSENIVKKNDRITQHIYFYQNKQIEQKIIYNENGQEIEIVSFYENGQIKMKSVKNEEVWYYPNGQLQKQVTLNPVDGISLAQEWFSDGALKSIYEQKGSFDIKHYYAMKRNGKAIPQDFKYDKNGKSITIRIDIDKEFGKGLLYFHTKGFDTAEELEKLTRKVAPKEILDYLDAIE